MKKRQLTRAVLLALWCWASVAEAQTTTPNFGWTIPAEHQDPWYNSIVSLFNEIDATVASISTTGGVGKTGSPLNSHCAFWTGANTISGEAACTWDAVNDILKAQRMQALTIMSAGTANSVTGTFRLLNATNANEAVIASTTPTATRTFTLPNADSNPVQPLACGGATFIKGIAGTGVIDCQTPAGSGGNVNNSGTPTSGQIASWTNATTIQGLTLVPVTAGGTGLAGGTSGGILGYAAAGTLASSGALGAGLPVVGGGAGAVPTSGTRSGNTTAYVTTTGTQTAGACVTIDANGNHIATTCAGGGNVSNSGTPTSGQVATWTNATTVQGVTLLPVAAGGTNLGTATDDALMVGNGTLWQSKVLPSCSAGNSALAYNIATNTFTCNTISGGTTPTGTGFTHITAGAQDAAAKLVDTADVNNSQITYAKIQDVSAASRLLGRGTSGVGPAQEIILGTNLSMSSNTLNATGGSGTTPTGTGFRHVTAGVEDAASKLIDTADINNSQVTYAKMQDVSGASRLIGRGAGAGAGVEQEITLGPNLSMTGTVLNASSSGSSDTVVRITGTDLSMTESTTIVDATGLAMAVAINTQYEFTCTVLANADIATSDFTFQFIAPSGATMWWSALGDQGVGFGNQPQAGVQVGGTGGLTSLDFGGLVGTTLISLRGTIFSAGTAGNVQMQWAMRQNPSGTQTVKLLKGSWCRYASLGATP